jgi:hypothetical protein
LNLIGDRSILDKNVMSCFFCLLTKTIKLACARSVELALKIMCCLLILLLICFWPIHVYAAEKRRVADDAFFTLENGMDLGQFGGRNISHMLVRLLAVTPAPMTAQTQAPPP